MPNWKMILGSKEKDTPGNVKMPTNVKASYGGKSITQAITDDKKK